jgi:hypothetical protein
MTTLELIEWVGGINWYVRCVSEWSMMVMDAHHGKFKSDYLNRKYRTMTVEYYILRESRYKLKTRPYKQRRKKLDPIV